jgi:hypothetical protein
VHHVLKGVCGCRVECNDRQQAVII